MATPQIGDTLKTSNGCPVARRIPRAVAGCRQPSSCIAAIDFGTTNCSVAYILPGETPEKGPNLLAFQGAFFRVPTAILFNKDGVVRSFGHIARKNYRNQKVDQMQNCAYFEQIKMNLQHDEVRPLFCVYTCYCITLQTDKDWEPPFGCGLYLL